jgi:hypothetical protein
MGKTGAHALRAEAVASTCGTIEQVVPNVTSKALQVRSANPTAELARISAGHIL